MSRAAFLCLTLLTFLAGRAVAAEVSASVDKNRVQTGGQIVLTLSVEGGSDYPSADFGTIEKDFEVMSAGTTQRTSIVNGRMTSSRERRYILVPKTAGQFTLGPLEIRVGGEVHNTNPITITVTAAPPPPAPPPLTEGEAGNTTGSEALFVQATVDNPRPYLYEQVTLRIRLYTRYQLLDNPGYNEPTTQGFWKENLPAPDLRVETVDGVRYNVLETMLALFPTKAGELTIGEAVLDCSVNDGSSGSQDAFSFFQRPSGRRVVLRTKPVSIQVQPLPPAPAGFQGAVGEYRLQVRADTREVAQGEPVTLDVSLSGTGHLRTVGEIELPPLPDFRSYPSEENQEITRNRGLIGGEITKQFVLVPLKAGRLTVPPLRVVTFSPSKKEYRILQGSPIELEVTPGSGMEARGSRGDIELLGRDIRFIELGTPSFRPVGDRWSRALRWLALLPLPTLALGGAWFWNRRVEAQGANAVWIRRRNAGRTARAILRAAQGKDRAESAAEAARALRTFVADRHDLPAAGLTPDIIAGHLSAEGKDPGPLLAFLDRCDAVRFAPRETAGAGDFLSEAESQIKTLEEK